MRLLASHLSARVSLLALTLLTAAAIRPAGAQPVVGFVEDFSTANDLSTWGGGAILSNPGTGGYGGVNDGYLDVLTLSADHLGTVSFGSEYAGDWTAANVKQVRCWLQDFSGRGDLFIHLAIANSAGQTWQQNTGLVPPVGSWGEYVIDMNGVDFTQTRGTPTTFSAVMQSVNRLHYRHDLPPYDASPDLIAGEFGLDHIQLTDGSTTDVGPGVPVAHPVLLAPPYPNPARGRVTFEIRQPEPRPITLSIFDAAGRRVRQVELAAAGSAPRLWLWDGRDDAGHPLAAGVYRALARGVNGGMSRTVTLLR